MDCCDGDSLAAACFDWQRAAIQWEERALKAEEELQSARGQIEALKGKVLQLQQMVFGRKSEKQEGQHPEAKPESGDAAETGAAAEELGGKRSRGQQRGAPGHGRRKHTELPEEPVIHDLPPEQRHCPHCGKAFAPLSGDETSEEIDWEVIVRRRVHHRRRYHRTCQCPQTPAITVAPGPPKLIPKGIFAVNAVTDLLVQKFLLARPTNKTISLLNLRSGLELSPGTVAGVMEKLHPLLAPLEAAIVERGRSAHHWHADETRWKVFEAVEGKENFNWWLWVFASTDTVVYLLDPRRSGTVPKAYFQKGVDGDLAGAGSQGILSRDRWAAYNGLEGILTQYCWAHERRDFIDAACSFPKLGSWRDTWLERIRELYRLHGQREQAPAGSDAFALADGPLRAHVASMAVVRDAELAEATNPGAEKVLRSMVKNWNGNTGCARWVLKVIICQQQRSSIWVFPAVPPPMGPSKNCKATWRFSKNTNPPGNCQL